MSQGFLAVGSEQHARLRPATVAVAPCVLISAGLLGAPADVGGLRRPPQSSTRAAAHRPMFQPSIWREKRGRRAVGVRPAAFVP